MSMICGALISSVAMMIFFKIPFSPLFFTLLVLIGSIMASVLIFKMFMLSWMTFVLIMVFSSGMMALFVYVSTLVPNEKKKSVVASFIFVFFLVLPTNAVFFNQSKFQMKGFTQQLFFLLLMGFLVLTMVAISLQSYNPQQSMSSTF